MSEVRDPLRDQKLPEEGGVGVQDRMIGMLSVGESTPTTQAIINALTERKAYGIRKYGRPLETHNGRDALLDAWEEALDLVSYLTQLVLENDPVYAFMFRWQNRSVEVLFALTEARLERGDTI